MNTDSTNLIDLFIPTVGKCTLFPSIDDLREDLNTYRAILEVARLLDLQELPMRSHEMTQEVFRVLANTFEKLEEVEVRILISGRHDSYPFINTAREQQEMGPCVTAMDIYMYEPKKLFGKANPFVKRIGMNLDEVPITEEQPNEELFYCLFLSAPK